MTRFALALAAFAGLALLPAATSADDASDLLAAARTNDIARVLSLVKAGSDVDAADANGTAALHVTASYGYLELTRVLLDAGADVDARGPLGNTPLILAAQEGYAEVAGLLLAAGADIGVHSDVAGSALKYATAYGHRDIVAAIDAVRGPVVEPVATWKWMVTALTAVFTVAALAVTREPRSLKPATAPVARAA